MSIALKLASTLLILCFSCNFWFLSQGVVRCG